MQDVTVEGKKIEGYSRFYALKCTNVHDVTGAYLIIVMPSIMSNCPNQRTKRNCNIAGLRAACDDESNLILHGRQAGEIAIER